MSTGGQPPIPSIPSRLPWEDFQTLLARIDRLTRAMEMTQGIASFPIGINIAPLISIEGMTTGQQMVTLFQELVPEAFGSSEILPFKKTVAVSTQDDLDRQVRIDGTVKFVLMAFPAGCHQLVDVRLVYYPTGGGRHYVVPSLEDGFIALDDFTVIFTPHFLVRSPGLLKVEWYNYDSLNPHTVPVIVMISPTGLTGGGSGG